MFVLCCCYFNKAYCHHEYCLQAHTVYVLCCCCLSPRVLSSRACYVCVLCCCYLHKAYCHYEYCLPVHVVYCIFISMPSELKKQDIRLKFSDIFGPEEKLRYFNVRNTTSFTCSHIKKWIMFAKAPASLFHDVSLNISCQNISEALIIQSQSLNWMSFCTRNLSALLFKRVSTSRISFCMQHIRSTRKQN